MPLWIQPRGHRDEVIGLRQEEVAIRLTAPPVDGAANKALCRFIADRTGVPASKVRLVRGQTSRRKWIVVEGFSAEELRRALLEDLPAQSGGHGRGGSYGGDPAVSEAVWKVMRRALLGFLIGGGMVLGVGAHAQVLRMDYRTNQGSGSLRRGPLEVNARHSRRISEPGMNVIQPVVVVRVNGREVGRLVGAEKVGDPATVVQLAEMDPGNPYPEVLLSSFTGGAHCCNQIQVLSSDPEGRSWKEVTLGPFDGGPSPAEDPLRNGRFLIVDVDNRFLYRFACYACGTAPARIWQLQGDRFVDVTHRPEFVPLHRRNLQRMASWFQEKNPDSANGFLAGYVANKALVGELNDGWDRMIRRYDRSSDWGLRECKGDYDEQGNCIGHEVEYGSFPDALRAFLVESGYISPAGQNESPLP